MLTKQRKQAILDALKRDGQVVAKTLSESFGVSEDTVRRDLRELASEGLLQRVHGGALLASPAEADFTHRQSIATKEKCAVALRAARMVSAGQVVIIDGGTTAVQMAQALPRTLAATVVTHSPSVAVALMDHAEIEVILIGGRLYKHSMVAVGAAALEALAHIRADTYFMGVTGVHTSAGLSTGDLEEAYMKRALASHAAETVVLASSEKLNAASRFKIGDLTLASTLVVDRMTDPVLTDGIEAQGVTIVRA